MLSVLLAGDCGRAPRRRRTVEPAVAPLPECGVPVSFLSQAATFFTSGSNWSGLERDPGTTTQPGQAFCGGGGWPPSWPGWASGALLGHTGRGSFAVVNAANAARAIPSFALIDADRHPACDRAAPGRRFRGRVHHHVRPGRAPHTHQCLCRASGKWPRPSARPPWRWA